MLFGNIKQGFDRAVKCNKNSHHLRPLPAFVIISHAHKLIV